MILLRSLLRWPALAVLCVTLSGAAGRCQSDGLGQSTPAAGVPAGSTYALQLPVPAPSAPVTAPTDEQREFMRQSARSAWSFVSRSMSPAAGFVGATDSYPYMTVWDMASTLASIHSARLLNLATQEQYRRAMDRSLSTIERMPLYDNAAFNKLYASNTGAMVDRANQRSEKGYGWSVLDHGRLLAWLKIIAENDPAFAARAQAIVAKLDMGRLVRDGYLQGEDLNPSTGAPRRYQEGRVGYEQYAAEAFALWGVRAERALDFAANGTPVLVNGQTVLADKRRDDLLTSEPFVMMGLEMGWTGPTWSSLSLAVLAAQEARFKETGIITMVSEDAVPDPPAYFYYYLLYHNGKPFVVTSPTGEIAPTYPRWISVKAAFGYHALAPSDYTWKALQAVKYGATTDRGWTAGVYEGTTKSTRLFNVNTAAIVLESAAYFERGCPLVRPTCPPRPGMTPDAPKDSAAVADSTSAKPATGTRATTTKSTRTARPRPKP